MAISRLNALKFIGLAVGLAAKFVTGSIFVFNVYQDSIKYNFNFTQTETELLSSMLNVGLGIGFVPGMFYDRFGPTLTSGAGLIVSVPVYLLIWSTTKYATFYSTKAWLMSIYFLLAGFGSVFTYMVALNTNVINFSEKHTGKVVGLLNAFFAGSPSVFATIFYNLFSHGDSTHPENQDFAGFMLFFAILFGVVNILCMVFLRIYKDSSDSDDISVKYYKSSNVYITQEYKTTEIDTVNNEKGSVEDANIKINIIEEERESMTVCQLACNLDFHLLSWMFAFVSSVGLVYGNNITVTSKSVWLDKYNDKLVIIIPITNAIVSASIGVLSDRFKEKIPRLTIVNVACVFLLISQVLVVTYASQIVVLMTATAFAGAGIGIIWSLFPTLMKEMFSVKQLGRNWGIALLLAALLAFASQEVFGVLYDAKLPAGKSNTCYSAQCIQSGYAVFAGVACISLAIGVIILVKKRCCK